MSWTWDPRHRQEYEEQGVTVLRRIIPQALIADLRVVAEQARRLCRQHGAQAQRLQPLDRSDLDLGPLRDYCQLEVLIQAVRTLLGSTVSHTGGLGTAGILFEPAEAPWCTTWHRDWGHHGIDLRHWLPVFFDERYFNQCNCPLYQDSSLWVVPGSHRRPTDTHAELQAQAGRLVEGEKPYPDPLGGERVILDYARGMPGAHQVVLEPGDFALYRNSLWHLGTYLPYQRRATLHDIVETEDYRLWREQRRLEGIPKHEPVAAPTPDPVPAPVELLTR